MEALQHLMGGFATALQPENLLFALIGCLLGTFVGVIPGIGPTAGIAILIPVTFVLPATPAIIMLAAVYYGTMFGGTITSILMNVPGCASVAVSCFEGYPMAKNGRAGPALAMNAIASFTGGTIATFGLVLVALPLVGVALRFGPPEIFALIVFALSLVTGLAGKSMARGGVSAGLGLLIASIGIDPVMGAPRFTFDRVETLDGFSIVTVVMGMFGIGEILLNAENPTRRVIEAKVSTIIPSRQDISDSIGPILRGSVIGFFFGVIPGVGSTVPTFVSYTTERRISKHPKKWGTTGAIEGLAGPEAANNSCANAALIPLFTLGIPGSPSVAILMGAFIMNGIIPGPALFTDYGELAWAVVASLYIGNVLLLIINMPMIPLWVAILKIPYSVLFGLILLFVVVGSYSLNNRVFDIGAVLAFGVMGYFFKKLDIPLAPLVMTLILTPMLERGLRRSLQLSNGDFMIFFNRPIAVTLLALAALFLITSSFRALSKVKGDVEV